MSVFGEIPNQRIESAQNTFLDFALPKLPIFHEYIQVTHQTGHFQIRLRIIKQNNFLCVGNLTKEVLDFFFF